MVTINSVIEYSLVLVVVYILFFTDSHFLFILPILVGFIFFRWMHRYDKKHNLRIPNYLYALGVLALYGNIFGEFFFRFYYHVVNYDKILHLLVPFYLVFVVNVFLKKNMVFRHVFIVLVVLGLSTVFELFEFGADLAFGAPLMQGVMVGSYKMQSELIDTMQDLFCALIGATMGAVALRLKIKNSAS